MISKAPRLALLGIALAMVAALLSLVMYSQAHRGMDRSQQPVATYSRFLDQVQAGEVTKAILVIPIRAGTGEVTYSLKNGTSARVIVPRDYRDVLTAMRAKLVDVEIRNASTMPSQILVNSTPFLLLLLVWLFMMWQLKGKRFTAKSL